MSTHAQRIGIMGGMFDPVHNGHLQLAHGARAYCRLDTVKLVPCGTPVHRDKALASAAQRIAMLELACGDQAWLQVDTRECKSAAPSYTWDTASALRAEYPEAALFLLLGLDAFLALDTWYRWRELFALVHLLVAVRPGYRFAPEKLAPEFRQEVAARMTEQVDTAAQQQAGRILLAELSLPEVSSTLVRQKLDAGDDVAALVPPPVARYMTTNGLYK